ncbi:MAG: serine protease [Candidatus Paceibacterota bacterium]
MTIQNIIKKVRSGVCKIEFFRGEEKINSGSGFLFKGCIVTNSHVFHPEGFIFPNDTKIVLIFGDGEKINLNINDLVLKNGSDEDNLDFAIYELLNLKNKYNFEVGNLKDVSEGDEVLILGFPFDAEYLTTHHGRISSLFEELKVKKIQIDASVNQGNSGGPLLHLASEKVIGIVTRKQSGLTKDFDDLLQSFSGNITILKQAQQNGSIGMMGINPIQFFEISQAQMQLISKNIKRSANTGIAYAFSCEQLIDM